MKILCKYEKVWKVRFSLIEFLENTCFFLFFVFCVSVCNSMGNELVEGAITSILKHNLSFKNE